MNELAKKQKVTLDGETLTLEQVVAVARYGAKADLHPTAKEKVLRSREYVDHLIATNQTVYGITTGFGMFSDVLISKEDAKKLIKKEVWLIENDFKKFSASAAPISLLGFMVVNKNEELGEVCEVIEQPHQLLCKIILDGKEVLIPVHEDSLEKIDKKNRKLFLNLPDGLIDIYRDA